MKNMTQYKAYGIDVSNEEHIASLNKAFDEGWQWIEGYRPSDPSPSRYIVPTGRFLLVILKGEKHDTRTP